MPDSIDYGSLPFAEQIAFFASKVLIPTARWADLWRDEHDVGFMVAGALKADLIADFFDAVSNAVDEGTTLAEFRRDFDVIVERHGWDYRGSRGWRSRLIYETNLRTSYAAGRYAQLQAVKPRRPYWRYHHSESVVTPRPLHLAWDGLVLRADDPWWRTHYPPNGWGCKCFVQALNERDLARLGKTGPDRTPDDGTREWTDKVTGEVHTIPNGVDPGWDYAPGASRTDLARARIERKYPRLPADLAEQLRSALAAIPPAAVPPLPDDDGRG